MWRWVHVAEPRGILFWEQLANDVGNVQDTIFSQCNRALFYVYMRLKVVGEDQEKGFAQ